MAIQMLETGAVDAVVCVQSDPEDRSCPRHTLCSQATALCDRDCPVLGLGESRREGGLGEGHQSVQGGVEPWPWLCPRLGIELANRDRVGAGLASEAAPPGRSYVLLHSGYAPL